MTTGALETRHPAVEPTPVRSAERPLGVSRIITLTQMLERLGTTLLDLLAGDPDVAGPVSGLSVYDPVDGEPPRPRSIVLGVGVDDPATLRALIDECANRQAAALVIRASVAADAEILERVRERGLVLLGLAPGATWLQFMALLESPAAALPPRRQGSALTGDLFDLANAICTLVDAPVTIEDMHCHVLAFSDRQEEADFIRIECILGRRTPETYRREDEDRGAVQAIRRATGTLYFDAIQLDDDRTAMPRMAVPIRAGDELLGVIWAVVKARPTLEQERHLLEGSRLVALQLLRQRIGADVDRRLAGERVATALEGGPEAVAALGCLGLAGTPCLVMSVALEGASSDGSIPVDDATLVHRFGERQRVAAALQVHLDASVAGSVAAVVGEQVYALVPVRRAGDADIALEASCRTFQLRSRSSGPLLMGIGRVASDGTELPRSRKDADRAIRVLQSGRDVRTVARSSEVDIEAFLLETRDLARAGEHGPTGAYARLLAYDAARNASMVPTLRAWLDAHGDIVIASEQSHVHQNTFRYRLKRISEIGEFDLADPRARFDLALQLRLFPAQPDGQNRRG